ncbi:transposase [Accumulibacter sp.]|uniref:transposase n=1 Tax=Accumulibacter sp. TaxID=2053492 RepID=UPI0028C4D45F|nr:transposase [Accumulibacter sp.]
MIREAPSKIFLIVDSLHVHHAKLVQQLAEPRQDKIELFYLPPCAPESNPDEYLNHDFKTSLRIMNCIAQWPRTHPTLFSTSSRRLRGSVSLFIGRVNDGPRPTKRPRKPGESQDFPLSDESGVATVLRVLPLTYLFNRAGWPRYLWSGPAGWC